MNFLKKYFLLFFIVTSNYFYSQYKNSNIVITVDNNIVTNAQGNIITRKNDIITKYNCNIIAGEIILTEENYKELLQKNFDDIYFVFGYSIICNGITKYYDYEIKDFKLNWLDQKYLVLYVYNTNDKKYKKKYTPLPGKSYTYEYDYPGGSMRRIQKYSNNKEKHCQ